jgi:hypothetical protein
MRRINKNKKRDKRTSVLPATKRNPNDCQAPGDDGPPTNADFGGMYLAADGILLIF